MKFIMHHHYGKREHENDGATLYEAAYKNIRETHHFLTDDNHTHRPGVAPNSIAIFYNENSPRPYPNGLVLGDPGDFWFSMNFEPVQP